MVLVCEGLLWLTVQVCEMAVQVWVLLLMSLSSLAWTVLVLVMVWVSPLFSLVTEGPFLLKCVITVYRVELSVLVQVVVLLLLGMGRCEVSVLVKFW